MNELIFPSEIQLEIIDITKADQHIDIYARSQRTGTTCPDCHQVSTDIHGRYWRHPQDLPCLGLKVQLHIQVRRFACRAKECARKTFVEEFSELLTPKARRTVRLREQHLATAHALGGEAGRRLLQSLQMPISGDTLIRDIRQSPETTETAVRVVGVDDWAMKKGQNYGTILVDLEQHRPIELLGTRDADEVATWFRAHPEIEIISRDRGKDYIKAANEGAPQAEQVADRWHLLNNLREAVTTFLQQKPGCLLAAAQISEGDQEKEPLISSAPPEDKPAGTIFAPEPPIAPQSAKNGPVTRADQAKAARLAHRQKKYETVRHLNQAGYSNRAIARQMKMSSQTVRKYIEAERCPRYPAGRVRHSQLTPWLPYLEERWQAGCTNASQLWREIGKKGFSGSLGLVGQWATNQRKLLPAEKRYRRQQASADKPGLSRQIRPVPWSAQRAAWLIILDEDKLDDDEQAARTRMLAADPQLVTVDRLARQFIQLVKERRHQELDRWLDDVAASDIKALQSFANGLRSDLASVRNALRLEWSNGQTEGQINRLKFIKRQMYGRANLDLLRKRVLYRPLRI